MALPNLVITNWVHDEVLARLTAHFNVTENPNRTPWPEALWLRHVSQADALMAFMPDHIDEALLENCPRLKMIACVLKGHDNFDLQACARRGIRVTYAEHSLTEPVAEFAIGMMIAVGRKVLVGDRLVRLGQFHGWRPQLYGTGLRGSDVGFIGMGAVGRATAAKLRTFGCRVHYYDVDRLSASDEQDLNVTFANLDQLAAENDFIVLSVPLTNETMHMIDEAFIERMRPGAYLINVARGSLINEAAVADALRSGRLGGYAADVFECEDWARKDHPANVHPALLKSEHTVLTPHIASAIDAVRLEVENEAADSLIEFFAAADPVGRVEVEGQR